MFMLYLIMITISSSIVFIFHQLYSWISMLFHSNSSILISSVIIEHTKHAWQHEFNFLILNLISLMPWFYFQFLSHSFESGVEYNKSHCYAVPSLTIASLQTVYVCMLRKTRYLSITYTFNSAMVNIQRLTPRRSYVTKCEWISRS